jgi:hypothetical protein
MYMVQRHMSKESIWGSFVHRAEHHAAVSRDLNHSMAPSSTDHSSYEFDCQDQIALMELTSGLHDLPRQMRIYPDKMHSSSTNIKALFIGGSACFTALAT